MTFGILIFPGAHGDKELKRVLEGVYEKKVKIIWNRETDLEGIDVLFIPGGFPCKGSSSSNRCIEESAVIEPMIEYAERGKILIGIGNGFGIGIGGNPSYVDSHAASYLPDMFRGLRRKKSVVR